MKGFGIYLQNLRVNFNQLFGSISSVLLPFMPTPICTHPLNPPTKSTLKAMNIGKYIQMYSE